MTRVESGSNSHSSTALQPADFIRLLRTHAGWWIVPAIAGAVVAGAYALLARGEWKATQALIIRPEVASVSEERLGKFSDLSEMKTSQETILELAKSQSVVRATLRDVGPSSGSAQVANWPTALDVVNFRDSVDMRPPGGAEFGKTEVFYLSVKDPNRDRARALVAALCNQLERRLQELRDQRAQGMIAELERTVAMADGDLAQHTNELSTFESKIGADLVELRSLNSDVGGQGEVSQELHGIEAERRANEAAQQQNERLLALLVATQQDHQQLLATPNSLLTSQPSVGQLKNALVAAQLRTADLLGTRQEHHPFIVAAREAERAIRNQLDAEVAVAIRGLEVEIELCAKREASLVAKKAASRERLAHLAAARAEYTNIVSSVQNHTRLVEAARKNLADARARQAAAHSASVISRIDGVEAGIRPVGAGRSTVTAAGGVGGLLIGLGCIFLFATPQTAPPASSKFGASLAACLRELAPQGAAQVVGLAARVTPAAAGRDPSTKPARTAAESFGMFRGLSLQDAVRAVQRRTGVK